ncbi:MAG: EamA family transporter [Clostridium sp.]|nr:EamA family transporter [Clostridium sp.]
MNNKNTIGIICTLFAASLWGTIGIFVRVLTEYGLDSTEITVIRFVVSTILIGIYIGVINPKNYKIKLKDIKLFFFVGIFCTLFYNISYSVAISKSSMSIAAVLLYTSPIIVTIVSIPIFKENITINKCIAVIMSVVGCALATGILTNESNRLSIEGFSWGIAAAIGYSMYNIFSRLLTQKYSTITILFYIFLFASLAGVLMIDINNIVLIFSANKSLLFIAVISGLICNVLPCFFYSVALSKMSSSDVAIVSSIELVVATVLGYFFFKEKIGIDSIFGIISILCSVVIINKSNKSRGVNYG